MSIPISDMTFKESHFNGDGNTWKAESLYDYIKAKEYEPFDLDLRAVNLTADTFESAGLYNFIFQCKRVMNCDKAIPIILGSRGEICDGYHRICRAILDGDQTIKAYRMEKMPPPDYAKKED